MFVRSVHFSLLTIYRELKLKSISNTRSNGILLRVSVVYLKTFAKSIIDFYNTN